jgi:hypothetical protein
MKKCLLILSLFLSLTLTSSALALSKGETCAFGSTKTGNCDTGLQCLQLSGSTYTCQDPKAVSDKAALGKITPPEAIRDLGFGSAGISNVLSNVIQIIYVVAAIVFVFMVVISAFQWIISGGDKEKISQARSRLTNAIIGIFLLAVAFVIIRVVGQITGFEFFSGQNNPLDSIDPGFQLPTAEQPTVEEYYRRQECNKIAAQGFQWNQTTKQCEPTN